MVRRLPSLYLRALRERPISTNVISGSIVMLCGDGIAQSIEYYKSHHHYLQHRHPHHYHLNNKDPEGSSNEKDDNDTSADQQHSTAAHAQTPTNNDTLTTITKTISNFFQTQYDPYRSGVIMSWSAVGDVPITLALFAVIERTLKPMGIPAMASLSQSMLKAVCFFVPGVIIRMPCFIIYMTSMEHIVGNLKVGRPLSTNYNECIQTIQTKLRKDLAPIMTNGACLWVPVNTVFFYLVPTELRTIGISFVAVGWMTYLSLMQHRDTPATSAAVDEVSTKAGTTPVVTAASADTPLKNRVVATSTTAAADSTVVD